VLGHAFWIRQYGGDPAVVGRSLTLDGRPAEIVGVLPAGSPWLDAADVFVPLERRSDPNRGSFEYSAIGRLKPGVTLAAATADLNRVAEELERRYPKDNTGLGIAALPSQSWVASDDLRRTLWILLGACGLLLLIACANVTNLQLVRGTARAHESALRTALGARRFDLVRERLVEAVLYGIAGAAIGLPLALGAIRWLRWLAPPDVPRIDRVSLDVPVFLFAAGIGVLAGILTGLISASSTPFGDVAHVLRGQRGAVGDRRLGRVRSLLVAAEVGISLVLLIGAGLLARSLTQVLTTDRGFQAAGRMLLTVSLPASYDEGRLETTARTLLERVRHLPDVLDAAMVSTRPLTNASTGLGIGAADHATDSGTAVPWATWRIVSEGYFKTIGLPLLAGRDFSDVDQLGRPWRVVVSKRVADLLWPGENAVGRHIVLWKGQESVDGEIIGVVGNMRERGLDADPTLAVYFPARGNARTTIQLAVHTRREPADVVPSIRAAIGGVDANLPVSDVRTLASLVDASVATRQLTMMLFGVFAGVALVLALAGVYGVLAYAVTRRTSEIGVRLALGAEGGSVLRLIVAQGLRPVIAGIACGLAAMLFLSRLMANLLFGVTARDPATYALVGLAFAVVAAAACYIPARRVLAVDPVRALRIE
jgi:predicted permease